MAGASPGRNLIKLAHDPVFWSSCRATCFVLVVCLTLEITLGGVLAFLLSYQVPGRRLLVGLLLIPSMAAPAGVGLMWQLMLDPNLGSLSRIQRLLGVSPVPWLGDPSTALWAVALVDVWQWTPMVGLILAGGLRDIPKGLLEAALLDQASGRRMIRFDIVPLMRPTLTAAALLRSIDLCKFFDTVYVMTQGGPLHATTTLNVYGYQLAFLDSEPSYAAMVQLMLIILIALVGAIFLRVERRMEL